MRGASWPKPTLTNAIQDRIIAMNRSTVVMSSADRDPAGSVLIPQAEANHTKAVRRSVPRAGDYATSRRMDAMAATAMRSAKPTRMPTSRTMSGSLRA